MNPILIVRLNFDTLADLYNEHQGIAIYANLTSWDTLSDSKNCLKFFDNNIFNQYNVIVYN
jgi:hypothetical protein